MSSATAMISRWRDAHLDAAADQARVERVVVAVDAQIGLRRHARSRTAGRLSGIAAGSGRIRSRSSASRSATTARVVRCTRSLMRSHQPSSWSWKSSGFAKRRPASKLPCRKRWLRSSAPLAWQSPASRITQPSASWPQKARNALGRAAPRRDRALAIPDQLARQRAEPRQAAAHPERDVRRTPSRTPARPRTRASRAARRSRRSRGASGPSRPGSRARGSHRSNCASSPGR